MTVRELIEKLSHMDPDVVVLITEDYSTFIREANDVRLSDKARDNPDTYYKNYIVIE